MVLRTDMNYIMMFVRIFSKKEYAEEFIEHGKFRLNTLGYFKNYEDKHEGNIGDTNEGLVFNFTKNQDVILQIKYGEIEEIIDFESVSAHNDYVLNKKIFCLYAPSVKSEEQFTLEEIQNIVSLDENTNNLGKFLVIITNPQEFMERIKKVVIENGYAIRTGLVEYWDFNNPVSIPDDKIGFVKSINYAHQKEFRVMIDDGKNQNSALNLEIGSLKDITVMIPTDKFNESIKVQPRVDNDEEDNFNS